MQVLYWSKDFLQSAAMHLFSEDFSISHLLILINDISLRKDTFSSYRKKKNAAPGKVLTQYLSSSHKCNNAGTAKGWKNKQHFTNICYSVCMNMVIFTKSSFAFPIKLPSSGNETHQNPSLIIQKYTTLLAAFSIPDVKNLKSKPKEGK